VGRAGSITHRAPPPFLSLLAASARTAGSGGVRAKRVEVAARAAGSGPIVARPSRGRTAAPDWPLPGPGGGSPSALNSGCWKAGQAICQASKLPLPQRQQGRKRRAGSITAAGTAGTLPLSSGVCHRRRAAPAPKPYRKLTLPKSGLRPGQREAASRCCRSASPWNGRRPARAPGADHAPESRPSLSLQLAVAGALRSRRTANVAGAIAVPAERAAGSPTLPPSAAGGPAPVAVSSMR